MQAALRLKTRVLPGGRIEVTDPELPENADVELIVMLPEETEAPQEFKDVLEFLDSLTPVQRTPAEWAQVEREFQQERNSWDS
jgi:hypothetical protein